MKSFTSIALVSATLALPASAETFTGFVGFGDSLSDKGRFGQLQPPSLEGRFSDGPVWMEIVGAEFEARGQANINLALGGATAGNVNDNDPLYLAQEAVTLRDPNDPDDIPFINLRSFDSQITSFLDAGFAADVGDNPLITVFLGGNDFLQSAGLVDPLQVIGDIAAGITRLALLGPQFDSFLVSTQPSFADGPGGAGLSDAERELQTQATIGYNLLLAAGLAEVALLTGVEIEFIDTFGIFESIFDEAEGAGLFIDQACTDTLTRFDPDPLNACFLPGASEAFLFVDNVHPGSFAHERFGAAVVAQIEDRLAPIPLPAGLPLLALGIAGLVGLRRKDQRGSAG